MIPIKDKKYMINCQGPYDYNKYEGEGICTGRTDIMDEETVYGFRIPGTTEICYFIDKEIIAEFSDDEKMNANYSPDIQNQIDSENDYCEKCDSCGETGCCPPIMCETVKCKYGEINIKDYRCFQDQWSVMYEALKDIKNANSYFLVQELAKNALNEVDNLWDKLYSKSQTTSHEPSVAVLSQRVEVALLEPSLATLSEREIAVQLTERFWKEDNPDTLREPPSIAYEMVEALIKKQKLIKIL